MMSKDGEREQALSIPGINAGFSAQTDERREGLHQPPFAVSRGAQRAGLPGTHQGPLDAPGDTHGYHEVGADTKHGKLTRGKRSMSRIGDVAGVAGGEHKAGRDRGIDDVRRDEVATAVGGGQCAKELVAQWPPWRRIRPA